MVALCGTARGSGLANGGGFVSAAETGSRASATSLCELRNVSRLFTLGAGRELLRVGDDPSLDRIAHDEPSHMRPQDVGDCPGVRRRLQRGPYRGVLPDDAVKVEPR